MTAQIPKLDDTNWTEWSIQMQALLTRKGLWPTVRGDDTMPETSPQSKTYKSWRRRNDEAIAELQLNVQPDQLSHLTGDIASEIWISLQEVHAAQGLGSRLTLRTELYSQRMDDSLTVQSYVANIRRCAFRLEQAGATISDEERLGVLLAGLPPRFGPFIVSLEALADSDRTFASVVRRLINENARLGTPAAAGAALVAGGRPAGATSRRPVAEITCFNCGQKGHYRADCQLPPVPTAYKHTTNAAVEGREYMF